MFKADWKLSDFQKLIEYGLDIGSKYFFLVGGGHGLFFIVRDTDSEGLDSSSKRFPKDILQIYAEGFGSEVSLEELNKKIGELYKGDICEWFRLSNDLLEEVKKQRKSGYTKLRISSPPLELKENYKNSIESNGFAVHGIAIHAGGSCPIDLFNAEIKFQYTNGSNSANLQKYYSGQPLFVDAEEAEIINFYLKVNNQNATPEDYFYIRKNFESKNRYVEAIKTHIYLERFLESPHEFRYYSQLAQLQLYAEDQLSSLKSNLKALDFKLSDVGILSNVANRYRDIGELEKARKYYQKAIDINSNDSILLYNFAILDKIENFQVTTLESFPLAFIFHYRIRKNGGVFHEKYNYTKATEEIIFRQMNIFHENTDIDYLAFIYESMKTPNLCKNFFEKILNQHNEKGLLKEVWSIGTEDDSNYDDIKSFMEDTDWDHISFLINRACSDACNSSRMDYIKKSFNFS